MKKITLSLNHVDDLIPQLAKSFNVEHHNNFGEYVMEIPQGEGSGTIYGINFPNGIGLHIINTTFYEDVTFEFSEDSISSLRFIYCEKGHLEHSFDSKAEVISISNYQHLITAPKYNESETIQFKGQTENLICYLEIDRERFQHQLAYDLTKIDKVFYSLFADVNNLSRVSQSGYYSLEISDIIADIISFEEEGLIRTNFLGAKALEVMAAMLSLYKEEKVGGSKKPILRKRDLDAVSNAVAYIEENVENLGTIPDIAQEVGLEPYKLQQGFKKIYGLTINDYVKDYRLKLALKMLTTENKTVSEIVYQLGLSSRSYFSKIFKEKYGVSPKEISKRTENGNGNDLDFDDDDLDDQSL